MVEKMGTDRGSMITCKSTLNQTTERLLQDVYEGFLILFYQMFYFMDPVNEDCIAALHYVYLAKINECLKVWQYAWTKHRMCTTRLTPLKLSIEGQLHHPGGIMFDNEALVFFTRLPAQITKITVYLKKVGRFLRDIQVFLISACKFSLIKFQTHLASQHYGIDIYQQAS